MIADDRVRIHFVPGLAKATSSSDEFVFKKSTNKSYTRERSFTVHLNSNNLFEYSLDLIEQVMARL